MFYDEFLAYDAIYTNRCSAGEPDRLRRAGLQPTIEANALAQLWLSLVLASYSDY